MAFLISSISDLSTIYNRSESLHVLAMDTLLSCLAVAIAVLSQQIMQLHQPVLRLYIPSVLDNAKTEVSRYGFLISAAETLWLYLLPYFQDTLYL